jgi:hypothetical protein
MQAFRFFKTLDLPEQNVSEITKFTVPTNKQLRIEFIAGNVTSPAGECEFVEVSINIFDAIGNTIGIYPVISNKEGKTDNWDLFKFSQLVSVYADSGTEVVVRINRFGSEPPGRGEVVLSISGQLFDV